MLELKSKNLFIKSGNMSHTVISKVLDFYELIGKNILLLHDQNSVMSSWVKFNNKLFTPSTLKNILENNLFRLDLIVIDTNQQIEQNYKTIRQITDIPVIFIDDLKNSKIKVKNFDTSYILSKSGGIPTGRLTSISSLTFDSDKLDNFIVECLNENWKSNLKELKIQYIRDKNLRDLLGDDE